MPKKVYSCASKVSAITKCFATSKKLAVDCTRL